MWIYVTLCHLCVGTYEIHKRALKNLELELWRAVNSQCGCCVRRWTWVLEMAASIFTH